MPEDWQPIARTFSALGDAYRQKILLLFEPSEQLSIKQIVDVIDLSRTAVVHHLNVLEQAGILKSHKKGREVLYHLDFESVLYALDMVGGYIKEMQQGENPHSPNDQG